MDVQDRHASDLLIFGARIGSMVALEQLEAKLVISESEMPQPLTR